MLLGDILAAARSASGAIQALLDAQEPSLARAVAAVSAREGLSPAAFVRIAVADFDRFATEDDWQALTSHLRNSSDPGMVCLMEMVRWRLALTGEMPSGPGSQDPQGQAPETTA